MTNEEILKAMHKRGEAGYGTAMELARADEREKITDEQIADYLAYLSDKEKALIVLNYLLRGGITDDDLRGLRLQWIKDEREKMQGVDVWVSWSDTGFGRPFMTDTQPIEEPVNKRICYNPLACKFIGGIDLAKGKLPIDIKEGQCKKFRIVEELP